MAGAALPTALLHKGLQVIFSLAAVFCFGFQPERGRGGGESMMSDEAELISVYYGADIEEAAAEAVVSKIEEKFPDVDVELQFGGQPVYYYIVSVE